MSDTPLWPAPRRRGAKIRHGWRCTRQATIEQATRRDPDGTIREVERCTECGADDYPERLLDAATQQPGPGAA